MNPEQSSKEQLAKYLARKVFECPAGSEPDDVRRIQFRGVGEIDMGGLCEAALARVLLKALEGPDND